MRYIFIILIALLYINPVYSAKKISELTDLTTGLAGADDMPIYDQSVGSTKRVGLDILRPFFNSMYDANSSNVCVATWDENDTSDRVLNFKVNAGDRTLDLSENLTVGDGANFTLTAEDTAGSIVLDEQTFEVEGEGTATRLMKLVNASDAAATLTIDGTSGKVDQDVSTSGTPGFDQSSASGNKPVLTLDQADVDKELLKLIGTATNGDDTGTVVQAADLSGAAITGYIKVYIQDDGDVVTDGTYYIPFYSAP
jgi:hypothetical protein